MFWAQCRGASVFPYPLHPELSVPCLLWGSLFFPKLPGYPRALPLLLAADKSALSCPHSACIGTSIPEHHAHWRKLGGAGLTSGGHF